jgi:hypothetical protein
MKDYANPLLLLIIIALLSWKVSIGIETPDSVEVSMLTLCVTGFIVNGALALARALSQRKALMSVVWSMVYLVFCSCCWVTLRHEKDYKQEVADYNELNAKWQEGGQNPFTLEDKNGRSLLELAAILGKKMAVRGLLAQPEAAQAHEAILKAAISAAENGHHDLLRMLSLQKNGYNFNRSMGGMTPLIAAVLNDNRQCVNVLLELHADPNMCDENGVSPIIHAVINNNMAIAAQLVKFGANPKLKDFVGRDAFSCSRSDKMDEILMPAE